MMLGGGCGQELAHWIVHGRPEKDMYSYDIRRVRTGPCALDLGGVGSVARAVEKEAFPEIQRASWKRCQPGQCCRGLGLADPWPSTVSGIPCASVLLDPPDSSRISSGTTSSHFADGETEAWRAGGTARVAQGVRLSRLLLVRVRRLGVRQP